MGIVEQYLLKLNTEKQRLRRVVSVLSLLSILVVITVGWSLRLTGITLANDACCGYAEHLHTEECPVELVLNCGYPEEPAESSAELSAPAAQPEIFPEPTPDAVIIDPETGEPITVEGEIPEEPEPPAPEPQPVHIHSDSCYQTVYLCGLEEHLHELTCYSDLSADIEYHDTWEATLPSPTGNWAEDLVRTAQSQIGCYESDQNFQVAEDGVSRRGITRYGQWYGNPYGDWSSMFVMFCLHYSDIPQQVIPWSPGVNNMMHLALDVDILNLPDDTIGEPGNILFLDTDGNGNADRSAIVTGAYGETLYIVGGDLENCVQEVTLSADDSRIMGYINVAALQPPAEPAPEETTPEETTPEETTPEETTPKETTPKETTPEETIPEETTPEETTPEETTPEETTPEETTPVETTPEETTPKETTPGETTPEETTPEETTSEEGAKPGEDIPSTEPTDEPEVDPNAPAIELEMELLSSEENPEQNQTDTLRITAHTSNINESMFTWQWQFSEDGLENWTDIEDATDLVYECEATEENIALYYRIQGRKVQKLRMTFAAPRAITTEDESGNITSGSVTPRSISKDSNVYTITVIAVPVDTNGNRLTGFSSTSLGSITLNSDKKIYIQDYFNNLPNKPNGVYHSAYYGTSDSGSGSVVTVNNVQATWRYKSITTYYVAYQNDIGTNNTWLRKASNNTSLYIRYTPQYTVTFASADLESMSEAVSYNQCPTLTAPGTWQREGYTLDGWTIDGDDTHTLYTYEALMARPITADVTYRAKWTLNRITIHFELGEYADHLHPISDLTIVPGYTLSPPPTPGWKETSEISMAFDGWYLDEELTQPMASDHIFTKDTTLYAKWAPKDDGYYVYFMDFYREGENSLVLVTYSVTEGNTASSFTPGNPPEGKAWNGLWYLDVECTEEFNFRIPVSQMTDKLTGTNNRDLYLYPGTEAVCRAIFVTNGTRIDPVTVPIGSTINLDNYTPTRTGYTFAGWKLSDETPVKGNQVMNENTTFHATWNPAYVPFEAVLRTENANDTDMSQVDILGTWYALSGSTIKVNSTYTGTGTNRTGVHKVVCVLDGQEYKVYTDSGLTTQATLSDTYSTYFVYNNTGTTWGDEVNWDDVFTRSPYSTKPISSAGDTVINFDYMRSRRDITFVIPNADAYIDIYKLYQSGMITGYVTYDGTAPTGTGKNVSAHGVSSTNISWRYETGTKNKYILEDVKYGQRIYEVYPVGGSWLTTDDSAFHWYRKGTSNDLFSSRRNDVDADFFSDNTSGRKLSTVDLNAEFQNQDKVALMYAVECLEGETPDFTLNQVGYKVQAQLCEIVNHTGTFSQKVIIGYNAVGNVTYTYGTSNNSRWTNQSVGDTKLLKLFGEDYWYIYNSYDGVDNVSDIDRVYVFYYSRYHLNLEFNFAYDADGDGSNDTKVYDGISYGENISQYQFGAPNQEHDPLLKRDDYYFAGWLDANGNIMDAKAWESLTATGDTQDSTMVFIAKWEKISNNIVEYYEDISSTTPFETHYFEDGSLPEFPTMAVYPQGWVWQEYGAGSYDRFDWDVPLYGESGVQEKRIIDDEEVVVNVVRIYGRWDESHTSVGYDPNPAQGGIPGTAPVDNNEYTIWQSEVSVMSRANTQNIDPNMVFSGWLLDRDGVVYQPGDHVQVRWPRKMIFTAQWAKQEEIIHLRYDPNGGTPQNFYPNETGFNYKKGSTAVVWNNTASDGSHHFTLTGYGFVGWNTQPDGSGTAYAPGDNIPLTDPTTTLYAQWQKQTHRFDLHKQDSVNGRALAGAEFNLYKLEDELFRLVESKVTDAEGNISFAEVETATLYKLVEAKPPDGYATITKEIFFRLTPADRTVTLEFCDSQGNATQSPSGVESDYLSGSTHLMMTVKNVAGFKLPSTGGIGTPIYILCGLIFMFTPLVYGFRLRRRQERRTDT